MSSINKKSAVTVIVAAYNAECFIRRSLDSILCQTLTDIELVVVDDGSTDSTGRIADDYAQKDNRVKVLHTLNGGVAAARQTGLEAASGEYIYFCDADDWAESNMLAEMYSAAACTGADMLFCDFFIHFANGEEIYQPQKPKALDRITLFGQYMSELYGTLWNRLIKRELFMKYGVRFYVGMNACEDQYAILQLLSHEITVSYLEKAFYHYDLGQNKSSIMNMGTTPEQKIRPLLMIAQIADITPVWQYYCNAFFRIAWISRFDSPALCQDYPTIFRPHMGKIMHASAPLRSKLPILLRTYLNPLCKALRYQ